MFFVYLPVFQIIDRKLLKAKKANIFRKINILKLIVYSTFICKLRYLRWGYDSKSSCANYGKLHFIYFKFLPVQSVSLENVNGCFGNFPLFSRKLKNSTVNFPKCNLHEIFTRSIKLFEYFSIRTGNRVHTNKK